MKRGLAIICMAIAPIAAMAQQAGTKAWEILRTPFSAYSVATGGDNITSHTDEQNLCQQNPALLQPGEKLRGAVTYANHIAGSNMVGASFTRAKTEKDAWAGYANFVPYGKMEERDQYGESLGEFGAVDMVFGGLYSRRLAKNFTMGLGLKFVYSQLAEYKAFGFAFDVGANYYIAESGWSIGLAARNFGVQAKTYTDTEDSRSGMPWNLEIGLSKRFEHAPFTIHVTYTDLNKWDLSYYKSEKTESSDVNRSDKAVEVGGADMFFRHFVFALDFHPVKAFGITASYNFRRSREFQMAEARSGAGFSFGLNINVRRVSVDAAYAIYGKAANVFAITASVNMLRETKRVYAEPTYNFY